MNKKYKIGYTSGVYDMFHIGHLNILKRAKELCEYLIVGVSTDELVKEYKGKNTIIPYEQRKQIVEAIKYVDKVIPQTTMNKMETYKQVGFNAVFVGSDWEGTEKWNKIEKDFKSVNVNVEYLPHTDGISSTILRDKFSIEN